MERYWARCCLDPSRATYYTGNPVAIVHIPADQQGRCYDSITLHPYPRADAPEYCWMVYRVGDTIREHAGRLP